MNTVRRILYTSLPSFLFTVRSDSDHIFQRVPSSFLSTFCQMDMSIPLEGHYLLLFNVQTFMTIFFAADKHALRNVDLTVRSDVTLPSGESATPCCRIHVISSSLSLSLPISYCQIWQGPCPESSFPTVRSVYAISRLMHLMHRTIRYILIVHGFPYVDLPVHGKCHVQEITIAPKSGSGWLLVSPVQAEEEGYTYQHYYGDQQEQEYNADYKYVMGLAPILQYTWSYFSIYNFYLFLSLISFKGTVSSV